MFLFQSHPPQHLYILIKGLIFYIMPTAAFIDYVQQLLVNQIQNIWLSELGGLSKDVYKYFVISEHNILSPPFAVRQPVFKSWLFYILIM